MARLEIQEKRGGTWWWWVLGLIILALIIWWVVAANHRESAEAEGVVAPVVTATPMVVAPTTTGTDSSGVTGAGAANSSTGTITNLSMLTGATAAGNLVGRQVMLMRVPVERAVSDKGFWIGSRESAGQGVFAVRGNQNASYTAPNGAVRSGTKVNVYGTVQAMPSDLTQQSTPWNLKSTDKSALASQSVYIQADSVRMAKP